MAFDRITLEIDDGVALLTFNDPEVFNAMGEAMLEEIMRCARPCRRMPQMGCGASCITGAGKAFCAGANLQDRGSGKSRPAGLVLETHYHPILRRVRRLHCPVVTAVNGAAAGGGMGLAMMGDIVIAARSAYFLQAFRRIGLVPDVGSTWLLPRRIGVARAMELSLLGEKLPAERRWNGGSSTASARMRADGRRRDVARKLAHGPTHALGLIRGLYWDSAAEQLRGTARSRIPHAARGWRDG